MTTAAPGRFALRPPGLVGHHDPPSRGDRASSALQRSLAGVDRPSERTLETLKRYDLDGAIARTSTTRS